MVDRALAASASTPGPTASQNIVQTGNPAVPTVTVTAPAPATAPPTVFQQILSSLNPLQYLPGVGTLYRAITGDTVPEATREAGSLLFSGLVAGPVGLASSIATTITEKLTGIDPDAIGRHLLASIGIGHDDQPASAAAPSVAAAPAPGSQGTAQPRVVAVTTTTDAARPATAARSAWSPAQLASYGVTTRADGTLQSADAEGADVLNGIELAQLVRARAAYGEAGDLAAPARGAPAVRVAA